MTQAEKYINEQIMVHELTPDELEDLKYARSLLENPGLAIKISNAIGTPIEKGIDLLPKGWYEFVDKATNKALEVATSSALFTMKRSRKDAANVTHKLVAAGLGAAGGLWGLPALSIELPASTTVMLRSIADIARSESHDLDDPLVKIACIEVFALGGPGKSDDAAETGYFAVRTALAKTLHDAAGQLAASGLAESSGSALVSIIAKVSSRFGVQVSEKIAAQALPLLGAAGGAVINTLFIDHFQSMARGHFIVRRLEGKYGQEFIRSIYGCLGESL